MLRTLIRPEILFLLGVGQALVPYLIWTFGGGVSSTGANVSYEPVAIWIAAYLSFCVGSRIASSSKKMQVEFDLRSSGKRVAAASIATIVGLILQIAWATSTYGTLPLLSYILGDGQMDVATANQLQESSALGQFGLLIVSTLLTNGILLTLLLWNAQSRRFRLLLTSSLTFVLLLANLMNGKRQGLFETAVYLLIGMTLWAGSPTRTLVELSILPKSRMLRSAFVCTALIFGIYLMGFMASARTQGWSDRSSAEEIISYLEYPIRNLATQCEQAGGFGPSSFDLLYPLQNLIPVKLVNTIFPSDVAPPTKAERTSPSGMFELIQWSWGMIGTIVYSFLLGIACTYTFHKATYDFKHLLMYPLVGYALLTAHSYNHFLNLTFVPLPCLLMCCYAKFIKPHRKIQSSEIRHAQRKSLQNKNLVIFGNVNP